MWGSRPAVTRVVIGVTKDRALRTSDAAGAVGAMIHRSVDMMLSSPWGDDNARRLNSARPVAPGIAGKAYRDMKPGRT